MLWQSSVDSETRRGGEKENWRVPSLFRFDPSLLESKIGL
jgi:hypothetical protein